MGWLLLCACASSSAPLVSDVDGDDDGRSYTVDCDDADPAIHPDALEHCDGVDEDCDGQVDEDAIDMASGYLDVDGDGHGDPATLVIACDVSGLVSGGGDCDDLDATVHPGADEHCDGHDEDCDAEVDEEAVDEQLWFTDADGDGVGGDGDVALGCETPAGMVASSGDCDDAEARVYPGADEVCDGLDNDCDGSADLGAIDAPNHYVDLDSDGFGDPDAWIVNCEETNGTVDDASDCDDHDATAYPGAPETCDGVDDDCDGEIDEGAPDCLN